MKKVTTTLCQIAENSAGVVGVHGIGPLRIVGQEERKKILVPSSDRALAI